GPADDGVESDLQRRRGRQSPGAGFTNRQTPLAISDGRHLAWHVAGDLHAGRKTAAARAGRHDADGVGAALDMGFDLSVVWACKSAGAGEPEGSHYLDRRSVRL